MPRFEIFPDAEAVVGAAIRNASISGLGTRVYSSIPRSPVYPLVLVRRVGGFPAVRQALDRASIQIEAWGDTKATAQRIAQEARVAVLLLEGTIVHTPVDAAITGVSDATGMFFSEDDVTDIDRYIFGMNVWLRKA